MINPLSTATPHTLMAAKIGEITLAKIHANIAHLRRRACAEDYLILNGLYYISSKIQNFTPRKQFKYTRNHLKIIQ